MRSKGARAAAQPAISLDPAAPGPRPTAPTSSLANSRSRKPSLPFDVVRAILLCAVEDERPLQYETESLKVINDDEAYSTLCRARSVCHQWNDVALDLLSSALIVGDFPGWSKRTRCLASYNGRLLQDVADGLPFRIRSLIDVPPDILYQDSLLENLHLFKSLEHLEITDVHASRAFSDDFAWPLGIRKPKLRSLFLSSTQERYYGRSGVVLKKTLSRLSQVVDLTALDFFSVASSDDACSVSLRWLERLQQPPVNLLRLVVDSETKKPVSRLSPSVFGQIGHLDFVLGNGSLSQYELEKDEDSYNFDYIGPASKVYLGFLAGKLRQLVLHLKVETTISIAQLPGLKIFQTVSRRYSSVRPEITIRGVTANKSKTSTLA